MVLPIVAHFVDNGVLPDKLLSVYQSLAKLSKDASSAQKHSHLQAVTNRIAWRALRTIESLTVPLSFYESEVKHIWGLSSLSESLSALDSLLTELQPSSKPNYAILEEVFDSLNFVREYLQLNDPPLWNVILEMCVDNVSAVSRTFVFSNPKARSLFSLALLAYQNITEDDLLELGITLTSLKRLYQQVDMVEGEAFDEPQHIGEEIILVGFPSYYSSPYMQPLLQRGFSILVWQHQLHILDRKVQFWSSRIYPSPRLFSTAVGSAIGIPEPDNFGTDSNIVIHTLRSPVYRSVQTKNMRGVPASTSRSQFAKPFDVVAEMTFLMQADDIPDLNPDSIAQSNLPNGGGLTVDEVYKVRFSNDSTITFAADDKVNFVMDSPRGTEVDTRYVSSLRQGDRLLYISGQSRQSLFDLLISRIYDNPAISLHVKLVERWQEDLVNAHNARTRTDPNWSINELYEQMRVHGTRIISSQTIKNWLEGDTLRPHDPEDLRRLADIFDLKFVGDHYKRMHRAGARLHGLHSSLSRRLNTWLHDGMPDLFSTDSSYDDVVDDELGLTLRDFTSSVMVLTVADISKEVGLFLRDSLGHIEIK